MAWADTSRGLSAVPNSDIWEVKEKIGVLVVASLVLHVFVIASFLIYTYIAENSGDKWGEDSAGAGDTSIAVNITASIPLPQKTVSPDNIVANDSNSLTQAPKEQPKQVDDPNAFTIQKNQPKLKPTPQAIHPNDAGIVKPNQNAVPNGQQSATNLQMTMVKTALGQGGLKVGQGDFGSRYAWYVDAVRRKISENWFKYEVDPNLSTANRVYLVFDIARDGSPSNVRVETSSGVPTLDQSATRSLQRIDTFGPLPPDYNGSRVSVEFYFDYKK